MVIFGVGFLVYAILVIAAFYAAPSWMQQSHEWRSVLAALPGAVLCGIFVLLYLYIRHNDELVWRITTASLAVSGVVGVSTQVVSVTRAAIGGYSEFDGATVLVVMALTFVVSSLFFTWKHR